MSERREKPLTPDEPALDPNETWGQGTDRSHPVPAPDSPDATNAGAQDGDAEREVQEERELFGEDVPGDPRSPRERS